MLSVVSLGRRSALTAKARVLRGRLLPDEFFWDLLFKYHSIKEIAQQLKNSSSYGIYLDHIDPEEIHRYQLESALSMVPLHEALKFRHFAGPKEWSVIEAWRSSYEASFLKRITRNIFTEKKDSTSLKEAINIMGELPFPALKLLESRDLSGILPLLKGTDYYEVIRSPLERIIREGGTLFTVEMAIDSYVMKKKHEALSGLHGSERRELMRLFGTKADLLNIYWLYRSKKFFDMRPEEMISRLLPYNYRISKKELRNFTFAPDLDAFLDLLEASRYGRFIQYPNDVDPEAAELVLERNINRLIHDVSVRIFLAGTSGIHTVIAYLVLREYEVQDLTTIIEDVRYDLSRRMAVLFLVRLMKGEGGS